MKKTLFAILFFIQLGFSQQEPELLPKIKNSFVAFEYEQTVTLADSILLNREILSEKDLTEVLRMQAIAHFSLDNLQLAEDSFHSILEIQPNFTLNESETSPKIIAFYDKIKLDYLSQKLDTDPGELEAEHFHLLQMQKALKDYKSGMLRSLIIPGWGHYYINENSKGLILNIGSLLTLAPGVFYAFQTEKYEREYLNMTNEDKIESSYRRYNNAYKNRNGFLAAFAVIWLYSQYDYFFTEHQTISLNTQFYLAPGGKPSALLQISFPF